MPKLIAAPLLLIFIWSTGFIAARAIAPHADPYLFLLIRFLIAAVGFSFLARNAHWPKGRQFTGHLLAGMLMNGIYLAASWWAVSNGLAAGVMALLGALQPLFTALIVALILHRPLGPRAWFGLALGLAGVALVLSPRLAGLDIEGVPAIPVMFGLCSILALTIGTMVQKSSLSEADLRAAGAVQHLGAAVVVAALLVLTGSAHWDNSPTLWAALIWSAGALSLGGTALFVWMIRAGDVTRITALMLLVPPAAALQAYLLFGETLTPVQFVGFAVALAGVAIVRRLRKPDPASS